MSRCRSWLCWFRSSSRADAWSTGDRCDAKSRSLSPASTWSSLTNVPRSFCAAALRNDGSQTRVCATVPRPPVVIEARKIVRPREARLVEREIDHHLRFVRPGRKRFVGQLAHVGEEHLEAARRAAPGDLVMEQELAAVLDPELAEQELPDRATAVPGVVVAVGVGEDALRVDRRELQRDGRVGRIVADPNLADLRRPGAAAPQHLLAFAPLDGRPDRPVVQCGEPPRGQALQDLHLGNQRRQQQRLGEPIFRAQVARRAVVGRPRFRLRLRDAMAALDERQQLLSVQAPGVLEVVAHPLRERLVALGDGVEEIADGDDFTQLQRLAPVDQELEHHLERGPLPLQ